MARRVSRASSGGRRPRRARDSHGEIGPRDRTVVRWEGTLAKEDRGFASMDRSKQRDIASKGGKAAHQKGTAHEWTTEEAREAGRKGGMASHRRKHQGDDSDPSEDDDAQMMVGG